MSVRQRLKFSDCKTCTHGTGTIKAACLGCTMGENYDEKVVEELDDDELMAFGEEMAGDED